MDKWKHRFFITIGKKNPRNINIGFYKMPGKVPGIVLILLLLFFYKMNGKIVGIFM
jgi:hypothetical protein